MTAGIVVVTGSASGIGAACLRRLSHRGTTVIGVDLRDAEIVADLGTSDGRRVAVDAVAERTGGRLDGLVTCAGVAGAPSRPGSTVVSVNYFGSVELLDGLRPLLAGATVPAAVAISSNSTTIQPAIPADLVTACLEGNEDAACRAADRFGAVAAYAASKMAIAYWVRRHAVTEEWAGSGIRLNAVAPGMTDTPLVAEPEMLPLVEALPIPVGRPGRPEEIAALVDLLLGPDGGFFCGSVVLVDGGTEALLRPTDWPAACEVDLGTMGKLFTGEG